MPCISQLAMSETKTVLARAPSSEPTKIQFFRPTASRLSAAQAEVDPYWSELAKRAVEQLQDRQALRNRVVAAWRGGQMD